MTRAINDMSTIGNRFRTELSNSAETKDIFELFCTSSINGDYNERFNAKIESNNFQRPNVYVLSFAEKFNLKLT